MEMQCLEAYPKAQDYLTIGIRNLDLFIKSLWVLYFTPVLEYSVYFLPDHATLKT